MYTPGLRSYSLTHLCAIGGASVNYSYEYDNVWRLKSITSPAGTFVYQYPVGLQQFGYQFPVSVQNLVASIALPNGSLITNTYDANARLTGTWLLNSLGGVLDSSVYSYNRGNQRTNLVRGGGVPSSVNYAYDPIGQVTNDLAYESLTGVPRLNEQLRYVYDAAGNLQTRTNNALVQSFAVNALNELTTESNTGTLTVMGTTTPMATNVTVNGSNAILYGDSTFAATNMPLATNYTALALGGEAAATNAVTVNAATNTTFQYDGNGNLTNDGFRKFAYDDENQLIQIRITNQWQSEFVYDGKMRRRVRKEYTWQSGNWIETNEVHYVYDGNLVVQERDTNDQVLVTYARGKDLSGSLQGAGGIGGLLARMDSIGPTYYHADGNGNITLLVNDSQTPVAKYVYDAFGNLISKSGILANANLYRFSSKETHANSGLIYYLYRYYDPHLQRWQNQDPIQEKGGNNLYEFGRNDSVSGVDPLGLDCCTVTVQCRRLGDDPNSTWKGFLTGYGFGLIDEGHPAVHCSVVANGQRYELNGHKNANQGSTVAGDHRWRVYSTIPKNGSNASGACACIAQNAQPLLDGAPPYHWYGPNSNTYAHKLIDTCGLKLAPYSTAFTLGPGSGGTIQLDEPVGAIGW